MDYARFWRIQCYLLGMLSVIFDLQECANRYLPSHESDQNLSRCTCIPIDELLRHILRTRKVYMSIKKIYIACRGRSISETDLYSDFVNRSNDRNGVLTFQFETSMKCAWCSRCQRRSLLETLFPDKQKREMEHTITSNLRSFHAVNSEYLSILIKFDLLVSYVADCLKLLSPTIFLRLDRNAAEKRYR